MVVRRSTKDSGSGLQAPNHLNNKTTNRADSKDDENRDNNQIVERGGITQKLSGSLFAAKIIDEPRRRGPSLGNGAEKIPPAAKKGKTKSVPTKLSKKKPAPLRSENNDFDNMADMFGTSPFHDSVVATSKETIKNFVNSPIRTAVTRKSPVNISLAPTQSPIRQSIRSPKKPLSPKRILLSPKKISPPPLIKHEKFDSGMAQKFEDLQKRFEQLNMLRTTSAEKLLADYKRQSELRDEAAKNLIESLKAENALLKERLENQISSRRDSNISTVSAISTVMSLETSNMIDLYKQLCGLVMTTLEENKWSCSLQGRHGQYAFELLYDPDEAEYTYTPVFTKESTVWDRLPSYLKEEIVFGEGYLQSFFWRALNFLMTQ